MTTTLLPVSVIVLCHRNDEQLKQALLSVAWAAEVIVIDDGAKLDVHAMEERYRARTVVRKKPISDFAQARNEAMTYATQEWVLFLDSDEVVMSESVNEISKAMQGRASGVQVRRRDVFFGRTLKYGEVGEMWLTRFGRVSAMTFVRPVHEIAVIQGQVTKSQIEILHYAHQSVAAFFTTVWRYAKIEAKFRHSHHQKFTISRLLLFPLGKLAQNLIWKRGFLDGMSGLAYALMMSLHSLLVSVFLYEYALKK